jgi:DNA polymerase-1
MRRKKMNNSMPNLAVLDGDIIAWKTAFVADSEGVNAIESLVGSQVFKWTPDGVENTLVALSCPRKDNFRREVFPGYKANRDGSYKPDCLGQVFECIEALNECIKLPRLEADDILGIYASSNEGISVSVDKDLRGVKGWYYNPEKNDVPYYISEEEAERWFCTQWMTGDSTDGIPGLWKIGIKTAEKLLDSWDKETWYDNIREMYEEGKHVPKNKYDVDDMCEAMGRCVKILTCDNYNKETDDITHWDSKGGV